MFMESNRQPVFVLGKPRCRTAWLSLCLSSLGVNCSHEGMRDHANFEEYADELNARLEYGPAGDSDPGLMYWLEDILARWPGARFVVVMREDNEGLEALLAAMPDADKDKARAGWTGYLAAFKGACDRLRSTASDCRFFMLDELRIDSVILDLAEHATGKRPSELWARRMQRLRVTSKIDLADCRFEMPKASPLEVLPLDGFDATGLSAALYQNADYETVSEWWRRHTGQLLPMAALPPLGVVVSDSEGPAAALWCFESYGVPVAELAFPVTRPGLGSKRAADALCYAVSACVASAGKAHIPEASFRFFKTFAPKGMARYLKRLGFQESVTERVAMTLSL